MLRLLIVCFSYLWSLQEQLGCEPPSQLLLAMGFAGIRTGYGCFAFDERGDYGL